MDKQRKNANAKYCFRKGQSTIEKRNNIGKRNMKILLFLSEIMIPLVLFYIVGFGMLMKNDVYENFVRGAREGRVFDSYHCIKLHAKSLEAA